MAFTPADLGRLVTPSAPVLSPDGSRAAFAVINVDMDANTYRSAVWTVPTDGSQPPRQLTVGEHTDGQPAWSPDGTRLVFTSRRQDDGKGDRKCTLHVIALDGPGEVLTLASSDEEFGQPVWSPDGTRLAYAARVRTDRYRAGDDERARPPRRITTMMSRLDSVGWTVDRPTQVFVVDADGLTPPVAVTTGELEHTDPVWTADGTRLVFTGQEPDWDLTQARPLFSAPVDGLVAGREAPPVTRLVDDDLCYMLPAVTPAGDAVVVYRSDDKLAGFPRLLRIPLDGGGQDEPVDLLGDLDRMVMPYPSMRRPAVIDDHVYVCADERGANHLYRVPLAGGPVRPVSTATQSLVGWDVVGDTLVVTATTRSVRPDLYRVDGDGHQHRLTHFAESFHRACPSHPVDHFRCPTADGEADGEAEGTLDVWVMLPDGVVPSQEEKVPVLLSVHGGPHTQYGVGWFDEFELWASAGFAVVWTDPRGATGQTEAFMQAIRSPKAAERPGSGWGGVDADDVLAALDAALDRFPVLDRARQGVLGGSYGGYMTSWLIGHTDRFKAACSERAVNNMLTLESTSDCGGMFRWEIGPTHLDEPEEYLRMSPITYVRDITTPVLILHAENDLRCHIEQADQLFIALRMLGKKLGDEVEYYRFPEESHELSRSGSPKHRVQRAQIILDWFTKHLHPEERPQPGPVRG